MNKKEIRDGIIETIKKAGNTAVIKLDGFNFSGADIALERENGELHVLRIAIIDCNPQKQFV